MKLPYSQIIALFLFFLVSTFNFISKFNFSLKFSQSRQLESVNLQNGPIKNLNGPFVKSYFELPASVNQIQKEILIDSIFDIQNLNSVDHSTLFQVFANEEANSADFFEDQQTYGSNVKLFIKLQLSSRSLYNFDQELIALDNNETNRKSIRITMKDTIQIQSIIFQESHHFDLYIEGKRIFSKLVTLPTIRNTSSSFSSSSSSSSSSTSTIPVHRNWFVQLSSPSVHSFLFTPLSIEIHDSSMIS